MRTIQDLKTGFHEGIETLNKIQDEILMQLKCSIIQLENSGETLTME